MECTGEDEVVICIELVESFAKGLVVNEAAGLVDYDESHDSPFEYISIQNL